MATYETIPGRDLTEQREAQLLHVPLLLRLWHLASLDAPTVAAVWMLGFGWASGVALSWRIPLGLALSAWAFYIADRLLDARRELAGRRLFAGEGSSALRPRHLFHWRYRRIFWPLAVTASVGAIASLWPILWSMPIEARERNLVLVVATLAYFASVHGGLRVGVAGAQTGSRRLPKELLVALLFTLACVAPVWTRDLTGRSAMIPAILGFIALAWFNCNAIERWESRGATWRGGGAFGKGVGLATLMGAAAVAELMSGRPPMAGLLVAGATSAASLALLDRFRERLSLTALRVLADLVLLTPVVLLAIRL